MCESIKTLTLLSFSHLAIVSSSEKDNEKTALDI